MAVKTLTGIFFVLLIIVGRKRGLKTFACFFLNYFLILAYILLMAWGLDAIVMSLLTCVASAALTLFVINGRSRKTTAAFLSVLAVLAVMFGLVAAVGLHGNIQGFSYETIEDIDFFSFEIGYSMTHLIIGMIAVCTIGTVTDTAMSVSTALNEVWENNRGLGERELFRSGMNVGRDILSTTVNTLFFAFFAGAVGLFFRRSNDSLSFLLNYKLLAQEIIELLLCCSGSVLVIPVSSFVTAKILTSE